MPFGLTNAPAVFQSLVNDNVEPHSFFLHRRYSNLFKIHGGAQGPSQTGSAEAVGEQAVCQGGEVQVSRPIHFLPGVYYRQGRVEMEPSKVSAVAEWPPPSTRKKLKQFLGFTNFYRRFIRGYSQIAAPLTALTSTKSTFAWTPEAETAFQGLKQRYVSTPILTQPNPSL